jgi:hypothetical protein
MLPHNPATRDTDDDMSDATNEPEVTLNGLDLDGDGVTDVIQEVTEVQTKDSTVTASPRS